MYIGTAVSEVRSINITRPLESNTASYERSTASSCEQSILASHRALPGQQQQQLPRESFTLPIYYRNDVFAMELSDTTQVMWRSLDAVHVTSLPGSLYVCLHFANAHEERGAVSSRQVHIHRCLIDCTQCNHHCQQCKSMCSGELVVFFSYELSLTYISCNNSAARVCVPGEL